jgi:hypothetical protein
MRTGSRVVSLFTETDRTGRPLLRVKSNTGDKKARETGRAEIWRIAQKQSA